MTKPNRNGVGSDADHELYSFFSGGYASELGLKSATGAQLDRLQFQLGQSVRIPDGYNDRVKFMVPGPGGRLDVTKVARALVKLMEPEVMARTKRGDPAPTPDPQWPHYYTVLRAYYTHRPHGAYEGLLDYSEFAGVALVVPRTRVFVHQYCEAQQAKELWVNLSAVARSRKERGEQLGLLRGRLRTVKASGHADRHLRSFQLVRQIEAGERASIFAPDTEERIRMKWSHPGEQHTLDALRHLGRVTRTPKDTPEREQARKTQAAILDESKRLWRAARTTYGRLRREVDREIREDRKRERSKDHDAFLASMEEIPADQD